MASPRLLRLLGAGPVAGLARRPRRLSGALSSGWRAYLIRTVTGELGPALDPASGSWAIELNGVESGSVVLRKADLGGVDRQWLTPWFAGVVLTYTFAGVERPIVAGPVTGWPTEDKDTLTVEFAGIRELLNRRVVRREGAPNSEVLVYRDTTRGALMWSLVNVAMAKPGGLLPIVHDAPDEAGTDVDYMQFEAWNLANAALGKRLQELSDDENGPDIMFRPRWANEARTALVWALVRGTTTNPTIAQAGVPDWDTTAARAAVESISVKSSADHLAGRVWATGAGEGAGTAIAKATDLTFVEAGGPLLEVVVSAQAEASAAEVARLARAELATRGDLLDQLSLGVRANDAKAPLGTWNVGDKANVTLGPDWFSVPAGTHQLRIIRASGDLTHKVALEFQEDAW